MEPTTPEAKAIEIQQNNIQWITDYLKSQIKVHGISFFLLLVAVWYFTGENRDMKADIKLCNQSKMEQADSDRKQMLELIINSTKVISNNSEVISNNTKALDRIK